MIRRVVVVAALALAACGGQTRANVGPGPGPAASSAPGSTGAPAAAGAPDYAKLPGASGSVSWTPPTPEIWTLSNGMPVYYLRQGPTPLVSVLLVIARGAASDPKGKAGLTSLMVDLLDEGAGGKSALELSEDLQRLGTDFGARADVDNVVLSVNAIAENFAASTKILADIARKPALSAAEFQRRKDQRIAEALSSEAEPTYGRDVVLRRALFAGGYAGEIASGTRSTLKSIGYGDVKQHYQKLVAPDGAALVVVGGIEREPVKQGLEAAFGDWKGKSTIKHAALSDAKPAPAIYLVDYPGASQSALGVARRAEGEHSPEYFAALVFNRAFGEAFTSRLNLNLREDKGYTYGARSSFARWDQIGYFGLFASVKAETTRPSIDEMLKELNGACGPRPLADKERKEAVEGLLLGLPGRFERISDVAGQFANLPLYNRPVDWFAKWPGRVQAIGLGEANALGKKYCDSKEFVIVVAGDKKSVEPTFEGLGLAVVGYDAQGRKLAK